MRGRKPVPDKLAELHGNPREHKRPKAPEGPGVLRTVPKHLTKTQRAAWRYAIQFAPVGLLRRIDQGVLEAFIVAQDLFRQAQTAFAAKPDFIVFGPTGAPYQNPLVGIIGTQGKNMLRAASELGFSPVSRPRTVAAGLPADLPLAQPQASDAGHTPQSLDQWIAEDTAQQPSTRH